jgi:hypothetical protein
MIFDLKLKAIDIIKKYSSAKPKNAPLKIEKNLLMNKFKLAYLLPGLALLASCTKDAVEDTETMVETDPQVETVSSEATVEAANPNPGAVLDVYYAGQQLPVETFKGDYVYQGDILLSKDMVTQEPVKMVFEKGETPSSNKSVGRTSARWPDNTVYYAIDSNLDNKARVYDAIQHWEDKTNVNFVERSSQSNYINFVSGSGCSSYIGMVGGRQNITLSSSCSTGNTIHEIGHALGLWHEQSRVDRENYITINYNNIQSGREHNFQTYAQQGWDGDEFTSTLDFGSIMMYGSYSFSNNGQPTIVKKSGATFSIQRNGLSSGDITGVNNMYPYSSGGGSSSTSTSTEPVYVNGQTYVIEGVTVYRSGDLWWYYSRTYGWKKVELRNGYWFYSR